MNEKKKSEGFIDILNLCRLDGTTISWEEMRRQTLQAILVPRRGDRYTEMFSAWLFVLCVYDEQVCFAQASAPCTLPDDAEIAWVSLAGFLDKMTYDSMPDKSPWVLCDRGYDVSWGDGCFTTT